MTLDPNILKALIGTDAIHFGVWEEGCSTLADAQKALQDRLLQHVPETPCSVLYIESGFGAVPGKLSASGHDVTALLPLTPLFEYARSNYPGPTYIKGSLLDNLPALVESSFDVIIFQEVSWNYPDLDALFTRLGKLLKDEGMLILSDEVVNRGKTVSSVHAYQSLDVEKQFARNGFVVLNHEKLDEVVLPTFDVVLKVLQDKQEDFSALHGDQLEKFSSQWQQKAEEFREGNCGYECWALRSERFAVRAYESGDEESILPLFNQVFNQDRTLAHWQWKFLNNPEGGPYISSAWDGERLAAHYAAYPVALTSNGKAESTMHVGDTFTLPSRRGVGRGKTNLISRVVRLFHKLWCEGKIDFFYGFNTGRIQKLGKNILSYEVIAPVHEFSCPATSEAVPWRARIAKRFSSYHSEISDKSGPWADSFFEQAKAHYPMLLTRDYRYLKWRYDEHPDYQYKVVLLKKAGEVVGWSVIREQENDMLLVDALVLPAHAKQLLLHTRLIVNQLNKEATLTGWFSQTPDWWKSALDSQGFTIRRQPQGLDLCLTFFSKRFSANEIRESFYFTMGDSDLY